MNARIFDLVRNGAVLVLVGFLLTVASTAAQSLKPETPYPLQPGINKGTADSLVGNQYWYFYATPGDSRVSVRMSKATDLYGTVPRNTSITFTLSDTKRTWRSVKVVTPNAPETSFTSEKVKARMKILVTVSAPNQNLIRMGGDYEIEVSGDVQFDPLSSADPIVRTYTAKTGLNSYGSVKFLADGTIETASGHRGTWKSFDRDNRIYTVSLNDGYKVSVQYLPGYGLVQPDAPSLIVFQELRR